jgi:hypothetical protein
MAQKQKIITFQWKTETVDLEKDLWTYKYALQEHPPIKLSNGMWLHSYRVTPFSNDPGGDPDEEQESFERELNP